MTDLDQYSKQLLLKIINFEPLLRSLIFQNKQEYAQSKRNLNFNHCSIGFSINGLMYTTAFNFSPQFFDQTTCNNQYSLKDARCRQWYIESADKTSFYLNKPTFNFGETIPILIQSACQRVLQFNPQTNEDEVNHVICLQIKLSSLQKYFQNFVRSTKQLYMIDPRSEIVVFNSKENKNSQDFKNILTLSQVELDNLESKSDANQFIKIIQQNYDKWVYKNISKISLFEFIRMNSEQIQFYYNRNGTNHLAIINPIIILDKLPQFQGVKQPLLQGFQAEIAYLQINILSDEDLKEQTKTLEMFSYYYLLAFGVLFIIFALFSISVTIYYSLKISQLLYAPINHLTEILRRITNDGKEGQLYQVLSEYEINSSEIFLSKETQLLYESFQGVFQMLLYTTDNFFVNNQTETLLRLHRNIGFFQQFQNNHAVGITHNNIGNILINQGHYFEALEHYQTSIIFAKYQIQEYCLHNFQLVFSSQLLLDQCFDNGDQQIQKNSVIDNDYQPHRHLQKLEKDFSLKCKDKFHSIQSQLEKQFIEGKLKQESQSKSNSPILKTQDRQNQQDEQLSQLSDCIVRSNQMSSQHSSQKQSIFLQRQNTNSFQANRRSTYYKKQVKQTPPQLNDKQNQQIHEKMSQNNIRQSISESNSTSYLRRITIKSKLQNKLQKKYASSKEINIEDILNNQKQYEEQIELLSNLYYRKQNYIYTLIAFQENLEQSQQYNNQYNFWFEIKVLLNQLLIILRKLPFCKYQEVIILSQISKSYFRLKKFKKSERIYQNCENLMKKLINQQQNPEDQKLIKSNFLSQKSHSKIKNQTSSNNNLSHITQNQQKQLPIQNSFSRKISYLQNNNYQFDSIKQDTDKIRRIKESNRKFQNKNANSPLKEESQWIYNITQFSEANEQYSKPFLQGTQENQRHLKYLESHISLEEKFNKNQSHNFDKSLSPQTPLMKSSAQRSNKNQSNENSKEDKYFRLKGASPRSNKNTNNFVRLSLFNLANSPTLKAGDQRVLKKLQERTSVLIQKLNFNSQKDDNDYFQQYFFHQKLEGNHSRSIQQQQAYKLKFQRRIYDYLSVQIKYIKAEYYIQKKQYFEAANILTMIFERNKTIMSHFPYKILYQLINIFNKYDIKCLELQEYERMFNPNIDVQAIVIIDNYSQCNLLAISLVSNLITNILTKQDDKLSITFIHQDYFEQYMHLTMISTIQSIISKIIQDILSTLTNMQLENLILLTTILDKKDSTENSINNFLDDLNSQQSQESEVINEEQQGDFIQKFIDKYLGEQKYNQNNIQNTNLSQLKSSIKLLNDLKSNQSSGDNINLLKSDSTQDPSQKFHKSKKFIQTKPLCNNGDIENIYEIDSFVELYPTFQNIGQTIETNSPLNENIPQLAHKLFSFQRNQQLAQIQQQNVTSVNQNPSFQQINNQNTINQKLENAPYEKILDEKSKNSQSLDIKNENEKKENFSQSYLEKSMLSSTSEPNNIHRRNLLFHLAVRQSLISLNYNQLQQYRALVISKSEKGLSQSKPKIDFPQKMLGQQLYQNIFSNQTFRYILYSTDDIIIIQNELFSQLCRLLSILKIQLIIIASNKGSNFLEKQSDYTYNYADQEIIKVFYSNKKLINYLKTKRNPFYQYTYTTFLQHF